MSVIYCSATAELSEGKGTEVHSRTVCVLWLSVCVCVCALSADVTELVWWERRVRGLKDSLLAWHSPVYSQCVLLRIYRLPPLPQPPHSSSYPSCFSPFVHSNTVERTSRDWTRPWRKERTRRKHNKIPSTKESKQSLHVRVHFFIFLLLINPKQEL